MVIILPGIVLLFFVSSQTGFSVHSRYVIPALPFFFVWMSKVGKVFSLQKRFLLKVIVTILLVWSIFTSLWVYPHSISYFNELAAILPTPNEPHSPKESEGTQFIVSLLNAGSRNGARHLLDSNIDWGQDIFYLEKWCLEHPEVTEISTAICGSYPLELTKIPSKSTPPPNVPQAGYYALSVNYIYDREKQYRYFLKFDPIATAGYSIYIYHVTLEDANRVRCELDAPELGVQSKGINSSGSGQLSMFLCPSFSSPYQQQRNDDSATNYLFNVGTRADLGEIPLTHPAHNKCVLGYWGEKLHPIWGNALHSNKTTDLVVPDGTSNTILFMEGAIPYDNNRGKHNSIITFDEWTRWSVICFTVRPPQHTLLCKPRANDGNGPGYWNPSNSANSMHPNGVNISMGDGSARFIAFSIDSQIWYSAGTKDVGETQLLPCYQTEFKK
jgi:prepilin-type processing-associated H-X9-DG protein